MRRKDRLHKKAVQTKKSQHWNSFNIKEILCLSLLKNHHEKTTLIKSLVAANDSTSRRKIC